MNLALIEASEALEKQEVPVGAVVVLENRIIAKAHNLTETLQDVTAHAEMQAITCAAAYLGGKYLKKCTLYVTLEPCCMCAGALYWSQISRVVFGAYDPKRGFTSQNTSLHPKTLIMGGVLEKKCATYLTFFFNEKRL